MTQTTEKARDWRTTTKYGAIIAVAVGVAFLVGLYAVAPQLQRGLATYLPPTLTNMPAALITLNTPEGTSIVLPVRIANTPDARTSGLRQVGADALTTTVLLYDQGRELTTRTTYNMTGLRAPLALAIIRADGTVTAIQKVAADAASAVVTERHRWVLATHEGTLAHMGITVGSKLVTDQIQRLT